jgi:hypothetical protein
MLTDYSDGIKSMCNYVGHWTHFYFFYFFLFLFIYFFLADSVLVSHQSVEVPRIEEQGTQDSSKPEVCLLDSESVNTEDDMDVFHSLENSGNTCDSINHLVLDSTVILSESPVKKQRVGNSDKQKGEVISAHVNSTAVKEQFALNSTTWKLENNLQNSVNDEETGAADTAEMGREVEEQVADLEVTESVMQEENDKNGRPVDIPEVNVKEKEEAVTVTSAEGKYFNVWKFHAAVTVCHKSDSCKPLDGLRLLNPL